MQQITNQIFLKVGSRLSQQKQVYVFGIDYPLEVDFEVVNIQILVQSFAYESWSVAFELIFVQMAHFPGFLSHYGFRFVVDVVSRRFKGFGLLHFEGAEHGVGTEVVVVD